MRHRFARVIAQSLSAATFAVTVAAASPAHADITPAAGMLRYPAVSDSRIAFTYANQVWTVSRSGGAATPVASPPGQALFPRFSPDGKTIAFSGNYDGNRDIYTVPLAGGVPTRVTHHPVAETLCGWTDDQTLLFYAGNNMTGMGPARVVRLYTVSASGGLPTKLPMAYAAFGAISKDGESVAFTPNSTDNATWRRYRGGQATDIWLLNLKTNQSRRITEWEGTDTLPMWGHGRAAKTVYYLSDNGPEHRLNIWSFDTATGERTQVTTFSDADVRWPSIGPGPIETRGKGEIVFQLASRLMLLDLDSKESRAISVTIPGARPAIKPRLDDASDNITSGDISPSGKRILLSARGDLWSVPAKEGVTRNLTTTGGVFEREGSYSPDGKLIAYISDKDGEYDLWLRASDAQPPEPEKKDDAKSDAADKPAEPAGAGASPAPSVLAQPTRLTDLGPGFRFGLNWSPDSKHIAFVDDGGVSRLATLNWNTDTRTATAEVKVIDTDPWGGIPGGSWSHDSSCIVYTRNDESSGLASLWLYNVAAGERTRLTGSMFDASSPAFDRKGDFLYYVSSNNFSSPRYGDRDTTFIYAGTQRLMMVSLRADVKNPLAPRSDEEELKKDDNKKDDKKSDEPRKNGDAKPDDKPDDKKEDKPANGADAPDTKSDKPDDKKPDEKPESKPDKKADKKPLKVDTDGFEARAMFLPVPSGNFGNLAVNDEGKLTYVRAASRGDDEKPSIRIFDPKDEAREEKTVTADAGGFSLSANGKKLLIRRGNRHQVLDAAAGGGKAADVPTGAMRVQIDPRQEWRQIITDTYRLQRDYFYVPNMHGVDWTAIRDFGLKMVDDAASREDVSFIIAEMISQLNIGHAYLGNPGDVDNGPSLAVGLLGCDFELARNDAGQPQAYRIKTIYQGAPWDSDARGPLSQPGPENKRVKEGDYLLAVNGAPVDPTMDPWAALVGLADKAVTLTVSDQPTLGAPGANQREILTTALASDTALRFRAWIERNRAYVAAKTDGKVGYIYVPNTGVDGQNELFRQYIGQRGMPGLMIDERWNGGGQIPTRFIELLNRPITNFWAQRHGKDTVWPPDGHAGAKCMLINGQAGSGGDMFPWLFKQNKLGKVFGTRTWGGLVGISGNPAFIDGGSMTVPTFGFFKKDGTWGVEGHGVDPDEVVIDDPALMLDSIAAAATMGVADPQLDAAITHMNGELAANPPMPPQRPAPPDRSGMGIPEKDR